MVEEFGDEAPAIYGAWCALLCVAADAPRRGLLADSRGEAYTLSRIALQTRMPVQVFEKLFAWASREDVSWLEVTETNSPCAVVAAQPTRNDDCAASTLPNRTEPNLTLPNGRTLGRREEKIFFSEAEYKALKPKMRKVAEKLGLPAKLKANDRDLIRDCVLLANVGYESPQWIDEAITGYRENKHKIDRPLGYFKGILRKKLEAMGCDLNDELAAIEPVKGAA